jgi:membrane protein implicated in regulation of membrane protease activity
MALYASDAAQYRYFTTDLLTNEVLAEIPFRGVSFERSIKAAGNFSGTIPVIPETAGMNLYESTMPGKTGLYIVRDQVCVWGGIIWNRAYNVVERSLSINANEFTSYFYHRNIWKTYTHDFGVDLTVSSGTVTGVLQTMNYSFPVGSSVRLVFPTTNMYEYNDYYTIATAPNPDQFTITGTSIPNGTYPDVTVYVRVDTYDYVRQLIDSVLEDFAGTTFPNTDIEPAQTERVVIYSKAITGNVATIVTATAHGIIPTQTVELYNVDTTLDGLWDVISTPTSTSFTFAVTAGNVATTLTPIVTKTVNKKAITDFLGTVTTSTSHGFTAGDIVEMTGVDGVTATVNNKKLTSNVATLTTSSAHGANIGDMVTVTNVDATFNGVYYIDDVPTTTTFTYGKTAADVPSAAVASGVAVISGFTDVFNTQHMIYTAPTATTFTVDLADTDMPETTVSGTVTKSAIVAVGTYGSFPGNSDIGIDYSTNDYSGLNVPNTNYRGYELRSVGEELDQYSDTVDGFEYRIDCDLVYVGDIPTFTRTFVLIPIDFPNPPSAGEVSPPSRYGADQLVFEYPGSIIDINMEESAEDAATRFFVVGNIPDLGEDASQPYAVASATDLLEAGWPILDQEETRNEEGDETALYSHAQRYLAEMRPPISDIKVKVNGSLSPKIGEFVPGDWCSIVIEDEFIRMRLASDLEVRDTVIVRKIEGFKVTVPDTPSFPEETELLLVTEPEVDKIG